MAAPNTEENPLPSGWKALIPEALLEKPLAVVRRERTAGQVVYPPEGCLFRALELTPPECVRAVILGQDPYHEKFQATGLAFAVTRECSKLPPSLKNILKELSTDLGEPMPSGYPDLTRWAEQGVLLLNTCLSVREGAAFSHASIGWQAVTDAVIAAVSAQCDPCVFMLWGAPAQSKRPLIDESRHGVLTSAHPSPLSAYRGFFGSKPFSKANDWLKRHHRPEINWSLN